MYSQRIKSIVVVMIAIFVCFCIPTNVNGLLKKSRPKIIGDDVRNENGVVTESSNNDDLLYFPISEGNRWEFFTEATTAAPVLNETKLVVDSDDGFVTIRSLISMGDSYLSLESYYYQIKDGVAYLNKKTTKMGNTDSNIMDYVSNYGVNGCLVLPKNPTKGMSWKCVEERKSGEVVTYIYTIEGTITLELAKETINACINVKKQNDENKNLHYVEYLYYCPNVGFVGQCTHATFYDDGSREVVCSTVFFWKIYE